MIGLTINALEIELGMPLSKQVLHEHKVKKVGPLSGIKIPQGVKLYWSKNCQINCFHEKFLLAPNLDVNTGKDLMYGTSAYLYFSKSSLYKVIFQLVGNYTEARLIVGRFLDVAKQSIDAPAKENGLYIWNNSESQIIAELQEGSQHARFHWMIK